MCGIVGYTGKRQAKELLLNCLEKLEYRGYDSAGIAVLDNSNIKYSKTEGRIQKLKKTTKKTNLEGFCGIAHTRWATHGKPDSVNSHPHFNTDKTIAVVHNGIIENYETLKKFLTDKGYVFTTDTDTEVIPHLIDYYYKDDLKNAIFKTVETLEGSYAVCLMHQNNPDTIIAFKKYSPLVIGVKKDEVFISSDTLAISSETKDIYFMEDEELAVVKKDNVTFYNFQKNTMKKETKRIEHSHISDDKMGYKHHMLKEIYEQPDAVKNTLSGHISKDKETTFGSMKKEDLANIHKIYMVACGSAYHCAVSGKYIIEQLSAISVETDIASEFRYRNPIINNKVLVVAISQSGETADTLAALKLAKQNGAKTLAITNVEGSTITREADLVFLTKAGPEISVASTKAYLTQLTAMYIFAIFLAEVTKHTSSSYINKLKNDILNIPFAIKEVVSLDRQTKLLAKKILNEKHIFYLGRGLDYAVALEGSLKLKETSYIQSEAYPAGELKHGPIALIDNCTTVVAINTNSALYQKTDSNIKEVISRGAKVIYITPEKNKSSYDETLYIPSTDDLLYPLVSTVPLQLLAYHTAVYKNCDVDKPKNLAKSVTVE